MKNKSVVVGCVLGAALILSLSCGSPDIKTEPGEVKKPAPPVKPAGFVMQPFHHAMKNEMEISYAQADEIIMGMYTGSNPSQQKTTAYYFDSFSVFNKETLTWESPVNVLLPVLALRIKPDVITERDFKRLSSEDKAGICWDPDKDTRYIYLVEGKYSIVFLENRFDEKTNTNNRCLIDTYPETNICSAKVIFDLMVEDITDR